ncbi:phage/plasmid primase, P4 family [Leisingera sp. D0M16]|uniref:phage/plasmid primase, P4 family n=1 Tax=Leisingera coralii TaxID=3351347 RepID=UPI003B7E40FF
MTAHEDNEDWLLNLAAAPIQPELTPLARYEEGHRSNDFASTIGWLVRKGHSESHILTMVLALNKELPHPLPEQEVIGIVRSISRYPRGATTELDEINLSRELARLLSGRVSYTTTHGWLYTLVDRWQCQNGEAIVQEAVKRFLENIVQGVRANTDPSRGDEHKSVKKIQTRTKVKALMELMRSDPVILRDGSDFDARRDLLNVRNGTIEINEDGFTFREHRAEDLLTKMADVDFDLNARCPTFDKVLSDALPDEEEAAFFLRFLGYSVSGLFDQQILGIFYGAGANGKSTLVNEIQACLGDYAVNVETSTFTVQKFSGVRNDLSRLNGARLAVSSELGMGEILDSSLMKKLTGGDKITARYLYKENFEFTPTAVPLFVTNALPVIDGGDPAMTRRIVVLGFKNIIPPEKRDPSLPGKLRAERSGIFNRLLEGMVDYIRMKGIRPPASITLATSQYGENSDMIGQFLGECTTADPKATVGAGDLLSEYRSWAMQNGLKGLSGPQFKAALEKRPGLINKRTKAGILWVGLALKGSVI